MAIHYLQSNMDVENIPLGDVQSSSAEAAGAEPADDDAVMTTDFGGGMAAGTQLGGGMITPADPLTLSIKEERIRKVVDTAYKKWNGDSGGPPEGVIQYNKFRISPVGGLMLKGFPDLWLMNKNTGEPRALSTIAGGTNGLAAIRDVMGYEDYGKASQKSRSERAAALAALQKTNDALAEAQAGIESAPPQALPDVASNVEEATSNVVETAPSEAGEPEQLPLRELRGLNKMLQTIRGELVNNLAKLTELDKHITREQNKLDEPDIGEFERRRIAERIRDLKDERVSRLEAASASREALRSQISRIRETINRLINEDTTLAERIRTLFREQGITIVSILTALGMVISTLVLAVGIGGASAAPPTPPSKAGLREWVKKYLHALGRVLAKLAAKAGAALPGIIGSVVGWLLNLLSKTAGWLASNLWALMLAVGSILLIAAREWLAIR